MKKLVLCDVDKTIVDVKYQITSPSLAKIIESVQSDNLLVGLNSDSPMIRLKRLASAWRMNGPIIAELGGVVNYHSVSWLRDKELWAAFFKKVLFRGCEQYPEENLLACDPAEFTRRTTLIDSLDSYWIIINSLRRVSFSCHFRRLVKSQLIIDPDFSATRADFILSLAQEEGLTDILIDKNDEYGILVLHNNGASKKQALPWVKEQFSGYQIYMIGDSDSDFLEDEAVVQCAVGNAKNSYKRNCRPDLIAPNDCNITQGTEYLLEKIAQL